MKRTINILNHFLNNSELERIDSECGEKVIKHRKFSSSTNRQRAIGYLLYELRELNSEEYDSDSKAIRAVRKYTICGENLLERFGLHNSDDTVLRRYLRVTRECIEKCEVFPLTKTGNE